MSDKHATTPTSQLLAYVCGLPDQDGRAEATTLEGIQEVLRELDRRIPPRRKTQEKYTVYVNGQKKEVDGSMLDINYDQAVYLAGLKGDSLTVVYKCKGGKSGTLWKGSPPVTLEDDISISVAWTGNA